MELLEYLKQASNTATDSIKSSHTYRDEMLLNLSKYQKAIHGISVHQNNNFSSENIKKVYSEFSDKAEYLQKSIGKLTAKAQSDFSDAYSELEKNARFVTIMLFGRSRTGKSTIMEALTSGDGHTIGIGKQNTTTEIKEYFLPKIKNGEILTKDALRIVDTPGIEGFDGEELAKMAERYIERCDHIFFLLSDDKATSSELERFGYIQTQGKGITVLLNIKSSDEDIDLLVENPEYIFKRDEIEGHNRRIKNYVAKHFDMLEPKVIPVHARAAWMGKRPDKTKVTIIGNHEILLRNSYIANVEKAIQKFIVEDSVLVRIRTPYDLINGYIISMKNELRPFAGQFRELMDKFKYLKKQFRNGIIKTKNHSIDRLKRARVVYESASNSIPSMVDNLITSGKSGKGLKDSWDSLLNDCGIMTISGNFVEKCNRDFQNELKEQSNIAAFDNLHVDVSEVEDLVDSYHQDKESASKHKYARAGLRAGAGTATIALTGWAVANFWNPSGWVAAVAAGIVVVSGIGAGRLAKAGTDVWAETTKKDLYKKKTGIIHSLRDKLWEDYRNTNKACYEWLDKTVNSYFEVVEEVMCPVGEQCKQIWKESVTCLEAMDSTATNLNRQMIYAILINLFSEFKSKKIVIHDVIREPGSICKIKVQASLGSNINALAYCIGKNGSRVKRIENVLCGEKVSFIDSNADIKQQLIQALYPARFSGNDIIINNIDGKYTAYIKSDGGNVALAIGRNGSNIRTATKILDMEIKVKGEVK